MAIDHQIEHRVPGIERSVERVNRGFQPIRPRSQDQQRTSADKQTGDVDGGRGFGNGDSRTIRSALRATQVAVRDVGRGLGGTVLQPKLIDADGKRERIKAEDGGSNGNGKARERKMFARKMIYSTAQARLKRLLADRDRLKVGIEKGCGSSIVAADILGISDAKKAETVDPNGVLRDLDYRIREIRQFLARMENAHKGRRVERQFKNEIPVVDLAGDIDEDTEPENTPEEIASETRAGFSGLIDAGDGLYHDDEISKILFDSHEMDKLEEKYADLIISGNEERA